MTHTNLIKSFFAVSLVSFLFYSTQSHAALPASVYSIPESAKPVFTTSSVSINTITKGYTAANDPVYKVIAQTVAKDLFVAAIRTSLRLSPYALIGLAAYDFYLDDDTGDLLKNSTYVSGKCDGSTSTLQACIDYVDSLYPDYYETIAFLNNQGTFYYIGWDDGTYHSIFTDPTSVNSPVNVTDDEIFDAAMQSDSSRNLFLNADGSVNPDMFPDPDFYTSTVTEQDYADLYGAGLLQSTDPLADYYVSPEVYEDAKELYESQNKTDEESANELTEAALQPITRDEYAQEQALKEARMEAEGTKIDAIDIEKLDRADEMEEQFNILDTAMTGINDSSLPSVLPDLPKFDYSSGCQTIELFTLSGTINFPNASQCSKLGVMKDLLSYFLYVVFFWMITVQLLKEAN